MNLQGKGKNRKNQVQGKGRNQGGAFGPGGYCICAKCKTKIPHQRGVKCTTLKCPQCGHTMIREELLQKNI